MNRRQYLVRAGSTAGGLATAAGCLDDGESPETDEGDAGSRTGERALDRAAGRLNATAQSLDEVEGLENPGEVEFDPEEPQTDLSAARDHLETAESELSEDRQGDVETLRSYANALEGLVAVTVAVTDEGLTDDIDTVTAALETEDDIEGASETVGDRHAELAEAHGRWDDADTTIRGLDGDRLDELANVDLADLEEGAATLGDVVTSFEALAGAYDATLGDVVTSFEALAGAYDATLGEEGYGALDRGRAHMEDRAYEEARTAFETAESTFSSAREDLESGRETAPEGVTGYVETADCQTRHLRQAAGEFGEGAAVAADDPLAAKRHRDDGEAALDAVGDCTE
ncbi:hypothetical protein [Natrinema longum]|uniref:Uncharacterized protein n=1 Tax=Natrinema longum TaxID=370324 RepID=A0A8A2UDJ3_9EURY|nr:hypothetical protein [Natrinema longum]MBZ6495347.1 hypothetical protein [Natrinema longum]QSW86680.1 hypothetical protein J0X27_07670 [Natrinema longum]